MVAVAIVTFVVALPGIGARATYGAHTTADEPQYLLSAISIGEDLDLDISDELAADRHLPFHEVPLNGQTIDLNDGGQRLSPHDPLLPWILAAPMRAGGFRAAKVALALIGAATAASTVWLAVRRFSVSSTTAAMIVGGFFVAPPLTSYATQVYPEIPAALCIVVGFAIVTSDPRPLTTSIGSACIVALPWLAVKYLPLALVLSVALIWRLSSADSTVSPLRWRLSRTGAVTTCALAGAAVLYVVAHQRIYGGWTVYAAGDHFVDGEFRVTGSAPNYVGRSTRLIGLLVDRGFGLVAWNPAYLALVPALIAPIASITPIARGRRCRCRCRFSDWALLVSLVAVGWAVATWVALTMHGWWSPGRQVVVVLPLGVVAIAALADRFARLTAPIVAGCMLGASSWLWLVVEASTGRRTLIVDFESTANPWYRIWSAVLPDHRQFATTDVVKTWVWMAMVAGAGIVVTRVLLAERRELSPIAERAPETLDPTSAGVDEPVEVLES